MLKFDLNAYFQVVRTLFMRMKYMGVILLSATAILHLLTEFYRLENIKNALTNLV